MAAFEASFPPRVVPKQLISSKVKAFQTFRKAGELFTSVLGKYKFTWQ